MRSLSVVIVTHDHREAVRAALPPLAEQLDDGDELIVVDNDSSDGTADSVRDVAPDAIVIDAGANLGFAAGCIRGASAASGELLLFLNPDAVVAPGFREAIEGPLAGGRGWAAWQGLVTAEAGTVVNTRGGVVHFTGIAWAGGAGEPVDRWEGRTGHGPRIQPGFVSGACLRPIEVSTFSPYGIDLRPIEGDARSAYRDHQGSGPAPGAGGPGAAAGGEVRWPSASPFPRRRVTTKQPDRLTLAFPRRRSTRSGADSRPIRSPSIWSA